jgi:hypothetical protein
MKLFPCVVLNIGLRDHTSPRPARGSTSYPMGTELLSSGVRWPGREADHLSPSDEVKNA